MCGYVFADFGSGVFHWATDNYGTDKTPVLGGVIAAFQGHHLFPWTITKRAVLNNIHKVAVPAIPLQVRDGSLVPHLQLGTRRGSRGRSARDCDGRDCV
jgi:hypothetical protein